MSQKKGRRRKKRKQKKILIGVYTGLILLLAVAAGYIWRSNYYKTHFYKDTWINGQDCSYLTASEVKNLLQETVSEYTLSIKTKEDEIYTVTGPQFHLTYVDDKGVDKLLAEGIVEKRGKRIFVVRVEITDPAGRKILTSTFSLFNLGKPLKV